MRSPAKFLRLVQSPLKFRTYLFFKIPGAFFSGLRIVHADENECSVSIPYKGFSGNPFKSTYFACLSMAAEMSTGVLAMLHSYGSKPAISMLVVKLEAEFMKKATGLTTFTCTDGSSIKQTIDRAMVCGEPASFAATSIGKDKDNNVIAQFIITWSFKSKSHLSPHLSQKERGQDLFP